MMEKILKMDKEYQKMRNTEKLTGCNKIRQDAIGSTGKKKWKTKKNWKNFEQLAVFLKNEIATFGKKDV